MKIIADLLTHYDKTFEAVKIKYSVEYFDQIFSFADFKKMLATKRFLNGDVMLLKNGEALPDSLIKFNRAHLSDQLLNPGRYSNKKIVSVFKNEKVGMKILSIYDFSEKINDFRRQLVQALKCEVSVNAYYSPASSQKILNAHRDAYNILLLQIHGQKKFHFGKMTDLPIKTDSQEIVLSAGEALYLPANLAHYADPDENEDSLHLTIGMNQLMFREYFDFFTKHNSEWKINFERKFPIDSRGDVSAEDLNIMIDKLSNCFNQTLKDKKNLEEFLNYVASKETIFDEQD